MSRTRVNVFNCRDVCGIVRRSADAVAHNCNDSMKVIVAAPAVSDVMVRKLEASKAGDLAELETCLGWHYLPDAVIFRVATQQM